MAFDQKDAWTPADLESAGVLDFKAAQAVEGFLTGLHASPHHGFSVEFAEHRLFNTGESTRHLDWKLLARTDKFFTKRYEEETNLRCQIVIDTSSSMYFPKRKEALKTKATSSPFPFIVLRHLLKCFANKEMP